MRPLNQLGDKDKPPTKTEMWALGFSALTGLGCGLMVLVAGIILVAVVVLLVI